jgi:lipopolysaccharide heptosyltransferase III
MNPATLLPGLPPGARVLIIRLRSIGDIVLLTPALRLVKEWRPDLRLSVVVESRFHELLEGNPAVEDIFAPGQGSGWGKFISRYEVIRSLRRCAFAISMNLHGGPTSRLLTRWSGARWRVGFAHFRASGLYHVLVPDARTILSQPSIHTAEHQAAAFFHLGLPRQEIPRAQLFSGLAQATWWNAKRRDLGITPGKPYAIVHPAALYKTKEWVFGKFAQIGEYLEKEAGLAPVYTCGPGESAVLDGVEKAAGTSIRRLEEMSLAQFAAALAGARLFVGNDSGPAHMAAALARPVVVIFGSSSSPIWGPWPQQSTRPAARVVQNPFDCNPCPGDRCYRFDKPECILSVTFDQVKDAVNAVLAQSA